MGSYSDELNRSIAMLAAERGYTEEIDLASRGLIDPMRVQRLAAAPEARNFLRPSDGAELVTVITDDARYGDQKHWAGRAGGEESLLVVVKYTPPAGKKPVPSRADVGNKAYSDMVAFGAEALKHAREIQPGQHASATARTLQKTLSECQKKEGRDWWVKDWEASVLRHVDEANPLAATFRALGELVARDARRRVECFYDTELVPYRASNKFVPRHLVLPGPAAELVARRYIRLTLPVLREDDIMARYIGARDGDIVVIVRKADRLYPRVLEAEKDHGALAQAVLDGLGSGILYIRMVVLNYKPQSIYLQCGGTRNGIEGDEGGTSDDDDDEQETEEEDHFVWEGEDD